MKVTAQEEYGLRCMLQLAAWPGGPLAVGDIARHEGLSDAYVEKLLRILSRAGLTRSHRGVRGGYTLTRPPQRISLGDVVRALGGIQTPDDICHRYTGNLKTCIHGEDCSIRLVWEGISTYVWQVLDGITISQLLAKDKLVQLAISGPAKTVLHI